MFIFTKPKDAKLFNKRFKCTLQSFMQFSENKRQEKDALLPF